MCIYIYIVYTYIYIYLKINSRCSEAGRIELLSLAVGRRGQPGGTSSPLVDVWFRCSLHSHSEPTHPHSWSCEYRTCHVVVRSDLSIPQVLAAGGASTCSHAWDCEQRERALTLGAGETRVWSSSRTGTSFVHSACAANTGVHTVASGCSARAPTSTTEWLLYFSGKESSATLRMHAYFLHCPCRSLTVWRWCHAPFYWLPHTPGTCDLWTHTLLCDHDPSLSDMTMNEETNTTSSLNVTTTWGSFTCGPASSYWICFKIVSLHFCMSTHNIMV